MKRYLKYGKVWLENNVVYKQCNDQKEFSETLTFLLNNFKSGVVIELIHGYLDEEKRIIATKYLGAKWTSLEKLSKGKKLENDDLIALKNAVTAAVDALDGDYEDLRNLNNIGVKRKSDGTWRVKFFEGGKREGAKNTAFRVALIYTNCSKLQPKATKDKRKAESGPPR